MMMCAHVSEPRLAARNYPSILHFSHKPDEEKADQIVKFRKILSHPILFLVLAMMRAESKTHRNL
jgi:hypothetical protein